MVVRLGRGLDILGGGMRGEGDGGDGIGPVG